MPESPFTLWCACARWEALGSSFLPCAWEKRAWVALLQKLLVHGWHWAALLLKLVGRNAWLIVIALVLVAIVRIASEIGSAQRRKDKVIIHKWQRLVSFVVYMPSSLWRWWRRETLPTMWLVWRRLHVGATRHRCHCVFRWMEHHGIDYRSARTNGRECHCF